MNKWEKVLITPQMILQEALQRINSAATQIALVVDDERRLLGTLSDGDIRRALLSGAKLTDSVEKFMFKTPTTAKSGETRERILEKMRRLRIHQMPVIDSNSRVVDLKTIDDYLVRLERNNWIVIMAGGYGTRLKELTRDTPKPMLPIGDKPLLETIIGRFADQGFTKIWLSVNYHADKIINYFGDGSNYGADIHYLREDKRLGTAGALSLLPNTPEQPFLVTNADLLANVDYVELLEAHIKSNSVATMAVREYEYQIPYGVIKTQEDRIESLEEKPVHQALVNAGIYALSPEALKCVPNDTFFDMPDLFNNLLKNGQTTRFHRINGYWLDIGRHEDFHKAIADFPEVFW